MIKYLIFFVSISLNFFLGYKLFNINHKEESKINNLVKKNNDLTNHVNINYRDVVRLKTLWPDYLEFVVASVEGNKIIITAINPKAPSLMERVKYKFEFASDGMKSMIISNVNTNQSGVIIFTDDNGDGVVDIKKEAGKTYHLKKLDWEEVEVGK